MGVGILTTAEKKGILKTEDQGIASRQMMQLNKAGEALGRIQGVKAITDVTGFGLLGHLVEMAEGSNLSAKIQFEKIPLITDDLEYYIDQKSVPGGTSRNWDSYGNKIVGITKITQAILADPQTSGGLLVAVDQSAVADVEAIFKIFGLENHLQPIGKFVSKDNFVVSVE